MRINTYFNSNETDFRTYGEIAEQENLPLFYVQIEIDPRDGPRCQLYEGMYSVQPDGRLTTTYVGYYDYLSLSGQKEATFNFTFYAQQFAPDGNPVEDEHKVTIEITFPVLPTLVMRTFSRNGSIENTDINDINVTITRTSLTTYTKAVVTYSKSQDETKNDLFYLTGENGQVDKGGIKRQKVFVH